MNQAIQDFIQGKRFAVVGVSRNAKKMGNGIVTELKQRGYEVYIVHPEAKEIDGEPCYSSLSALRGRVDGVIVSVTPEKATAVIQEAVQAGIQQIWLQQGAQSPEALAKARELGVTPVTGKCIPMYMQPVGSIHAFHRFVAKIFGQV
jgi:predicted CoA-binding protein